MADPLSALDKLDEGEARRLLIHLGAMAALRDYERGRAISYAGELLANGVPVPAVRVRLQSRYGLSYRSAYRAIGAARLALGTPTMAS